MEVNRLTARLRWRHVNIILMLDKQGGFSLSITHDRLVSHPWCTFNRNIQRRNFEIGLQIKPNWCKIFLNMFISFLYTFRVTMCPSSGETTVFMRHLVLVIVKQVDSLKLQGCMSQNEGCYWQASRPKHVEINKYTKK